MGKRGSKKPASPRPVAISRAEYHVDAVRLSAPQRKIVDEALSRGEDVREEMEKTITSYGRWLLDTVFNGDTTAALDDHSKNPIWLELVRRAGGPTLRISDRILYVALRIAAYDKRIPAQEWRGLDVGRKELLLPLAVEEQLRESAQHVARFNLTQAKTRAYVAELRKEAGKPPAVRITVKGVVGRVRKLRSAFDGPKVLKRMSELRDTLDGKERARAADEIDALRDVLAKLTRVLRGTR